MAHFARIDENNIVVDVQVVHNSLEHRGADFLSIDLGLGGRWIQTSYNGNIRRRFAGIGYTYDEYSDVFIEPKPFPSWKLDENYNWKAPIPRPDIEGLVYWNEEEKIWKVVE